MSVETAIRASYSGGGGGGPDPGRLLSPPLWEGSCARGPAWKRPRGAQAWGRGGGRGRPQGHESERPGRAEEGVAPPHSRARRPPRPARGRPAPPPPSWPPPRLGLRLRRRWGGAAGGALSARPALPRVALPWLRSGGHGARGSGGPRGGRMAGGAGAGARGGAGRAGGAGGPRARPPLTLPCLPQIRLPRPPAARALVVARLPHGAPRRPPDALPL